VPLTIILEEAKAKPVFICDYCNQEITDAFDGNYEWNEPEGVNRITDIKFIHKECGMLYDQKYGRNDCNMGIHNLMVYLLNNLNLRPEQLKEAYRNTADLSQLG
jgi:hypothetical protein